MRTICPELVDTSKETKVTITPSFFPGDYDDAYPECRVNIEYYESGRMIFTAYFDKLLSDDPWPFGSNGEYAIWRAEDLLEGSLSSVGLGGLETLDIYKVSGMSPYLAKFRMAEILEKALNLPYYTLDDFHQVHHPEGCAPVDCFYNLVID